jgi:hypothetical protein
MQNSNTKWYYKRSLYFHVAMKLKTKNTTLSEQLQLLKIWGNKICLIQQFQSIMEKL